MKNLGTYFEIPVTNMDRAIKFYSYIFNVEFTKAIIHECEMAFFPFDKDGQGITGALAKGNIYRPSIQGSLIYLSTNNIDESISKVKQIGGEELFPKTLVPNVGYSAEFKDCEVNRVALFEALK